MNESVRRAGWDLSSAVEAAIAFRDERDWRQFHRPKDLAAGLAIEAAELQELFLWEERLTAEEIAQDGKRMERIAEELADVCLYAVTLAHDLDINLSDAMKQKIVRNAERYPADRSRGSAEKHHTTEGGCGCRVRGPALPRRIGSAGAQQGG